MNHSTISMRSLAPQPQEERLAELLDEYLSALERGAPTDLEKIVQDNPALEEDIRAFAQSLNALHQATQAMHGEDACAALDHQKKILGDFEIGSEIGRGGMGVVYEARQLSLDRQVALKVLPFAAMWDEKQIVRFRNEAQAAAQLHHPHIVPVFAVGQERGVHFYAMQFVSGRSLGEVIHDTRNLHHNKMLSPSGKATPADAAPQEPTEHSQLAQEFSQSPSNYYRTIARLGVQAAQALHHAHECGVVHRDVKPANLLLDHQGKLWITDFGLARVQNNPGMTVTGDVMGTLRYMSPEQATGQQALVDQRTDVYALGATLYELLTLRAAFPGDDRQHVLQAIEREEPASLRSSSPALPADLETIVLQAMAKSRDRRYPTAQALAEDLNRFLQGKPTVARRPTMLDRTTKWIRRHRYAATAALLMLIAVATLSTISAVLLARETAEKNTALRIAENNLQQARRVVDRFGTHFSRQLEQLPGSDPLRRELLQDTLSYYQGFLANSSSDPELQTELAVTAFQAARIAWRLGKPAEARQLYTQALQLFEQLGPASGASCEPLQNRATCLNELGLLEASQGNVPQAQQHYQDAIRQQSKLAEAEHDDPQAFRTLAEMQVNLGLLQRQIGESDLAKSSIQQAITLLQQLLERYPQESRHAHDLAIALNNLSFVEQEADGQAARNSCQAAIEILENLLAKKDDATRETPPEDLERKSDLALCYNNLGAIESHLGQHRQACALHRQAIEQQQQLLRQAPAVLRYRSDLAISWNNLGQALVQANAAAESRAAFETGREILAKLAEDFPSEVSFQSSLAGVLNNQAMALEKIGDLPLALELYEAAIQQQRAAVAHAPQLVACRENLNKHYLNYGRALRKADRPIAAAEVARQRRQLRANDGQHLYHVARELAQAAHQLDEHHQAEAKKQMAEDAVSLLEQARTAQQQPLSGPIHVADFLAFKNHVGFQNLLSKEK